MSNRERDHGGMIPLFCLRAAFVLFDDENSHNEHHKLPGLHSLPTTLSFRFSFFVCAVSVEDHLT